MTRILLMTASGLARETLASIRSAGHGRDVVVGFLDDDPSLHGTLLDGVPVLGGLDVAADRPERLLICAGPGSARAAIDSRLLALGVGAERFTTHVHPTAVVGAGSRIRAGSILLAGCVLTCDVTLGRHVVLMPQTVLTHDDVLEDHVTCAAGATLGGRVHVGARTSLGMQASVRQDVRLGSDVVVGAGAVVLHDVPDGQTWAGNPAARLAGASTAALTREGTPA